MIPGAAILFVAFVLTILVAAALGKADGYRQDASDGGRHAG